MSDRRPAAGRRPVSNPYRVSERAPYHAEPPTVQFMVRRLADMFPRSSGRDPGFPVVVTPEGAERDVIAALPRSGHADRHVADAITAFVEDATADLLDGTAYLDIALSDVEKDGRAAGFRVHLIPAQSVRKRRGKYVQEIIDRDDDGEIRRCVVRLDKRWIVPIRLPRDLRKDISRAKEMLRAVDDHHYRRMPDLLRHDSPAAGRFDLTAYMTLVDDALLRHTRALGWDGFVTTSEGLLVPHRAWRALRLARVQVRLRDLLMTGLQEAFSVASAAVTTPLSFRVDGLTQLADLDDLEDALADGRRPLSEMFRALHRSDPH